MQENTFQRFTQSKISAEKLTLNEAVKVIKDINEEQQYWYRETKPMFKPVPNMSGRAPCSEMENVTSDVISEKIDERFISFTLECILKHKGLSLYVHDGPFMFYPVFGVLHKPSKEVEYLLKFKQKHCSDMLFKKIEECLYSKTNMEKHSKFGLKKIHELSHYDY